MSMPGDLAGETGLDAEDQIARELVRVQEDSYGAGTRSTRVLIGEDSVVAILDIELSVAERTLLDAGKAEAIKTMRESYQLAIGPTFSAIVERATGRRVSAFLSSILIEPLFTVEVFRLEPERPPTG